MKQPYYDVCPACGVNLDPGERCDCGNKEAPGEVATSNREQAQ